MFSAALLPPGAALVVHAPWLLLAAVCALPFSAANCWYAWRNQERSLVNGLAAVVPACGMLPVAALLGDRTWAQSRQPAPACLLYFAGTVPYVKTMIRERDSAAYRWASWLGLFFAVCLARAVVMPAPGRVRIPVVGAVEVVLSLLLLAVVVPVYG